MSEKEDGPPLWRAVFNSAVKLLHNGVEEPEETAGEQRRVVRYRSLNRRQSNRSRMLIEAGAESADLTFKLLSAMVLVPLLWLEVGAALWRSISPETLRTLIAGFGSTVALAAMYGQPQRLPRSVLLGGFGTTEKSCPTQFDRLWQFFSNLSGQGLHTYLVPFPGETTRPYSVARLRRSNMRQVSSDTLLIASSPSRSLRRYPVITQIT